MENDRPSRSILRPRRIVALEPESSLARLVQSALERHHSVTMVGDVPALRAALEAPKPPHLALVSLPGDRAAAQPLLELFEQLDRRPLVLAAVSSLDDTTLDSFVRSVVDDVILKPFTAEALQVRVRLVTARMALGPDVGTPARVLRGAIRQKADAEIFVRSTVGTGRIYLSAGQVAWAHCPWRPLPLGRVLQGAGIRFDDEVLRAVLGESRSRHVSFVDVLDEWGLGSREVVEPVLKEELAATVRALLDADGAVAMMVPSEWREARAPRFDASEVVREHGVLDTIPPPDDHDPPSLPEADPEHVSEIAGVVARMRGVHSVAVIDVRDSTFLRVRGPATIDIAWSLLPVLGVHTTPAVREAVAVAGTTLFGLWRREGGRRALFASFDLSTTVLGMVLRQVRDLFDKLDVGSGEVEPGAGSPDSRRSE